VAPEHTCKESKIFSFFCTAFQELFRKNIFLNAENKEKFFIIFQRTKVSIIAIKGEIKRGIRALLIRFPKCIASNQILDIHEPTNPPIIE
jgi:hypothetical protein